MSRYFFIALLAIASLLATPLSTAQEPARFALLIGNKGYTDKVGPLKNPHNDVGLVETSLKRLGFKVVVEKDAGYKQMDIAIKRHIAEVRRSGPGAIGFLYYTGHGAANPETQINYLIPTDVSDAKDPNLWYGSFEQTDLVEKLSKQAPLGIHFVVFDACRNELQLPTLGTKSMVTEKGFVPVAQTNGVLVAYATAPKQTASDEGDGSGPYAKALAEEIVKPGVEAVTMFFNVHRRVKQSMGQDPWISTPVLPETYLAGRANSTAPGATKSAHQASPLEVAEFCQKVAGISDAGVVKSLTESYQDSPMAACAAARLDALRKQQMAASSSRQVETAPVAQEAEYSTVSLIYGTDRKRSNGTKGLRFGSDRARALDVGNVVVTVPKTHQASNLERPWSIRIPYLDAVIHQEQEDPKKHFTMKETSSKPRAETVTLIDRKLQQAKRFKDHALIFVHGYNESFENAAFRAAYLAYNLNFDGAILLYSWPSGGTVTSYAYDRESAAQAEQYFSDFLQVVRQASSAKQISVLAYGMGSGLVIGALRSSLQGQPSDRRLAEIILAAPDMDRDVFAAAVVKLRGQVRGITLYASANDIGLMAAKRFTGSPRAGDISATGPVVVPGVDTIDTTTLTGTVLALNHSNYSEGSTLLNDIQRLLSTGERPPSKRLPILQSMQTPEGVYWRYPTR